MDRKAEFLKIWTERVQRDYADALLAWLERETDFFEAPASTRHHGAHPGGLLEHSLNVYHRLRAIVCVETYGATTSDLLAEDVEETVAVLAPAARRVQGELLPHRNPPAEEPGNRILGGLPNVCVSGPPPTGPRREKPVPDPASHGPGAGGGPGHPVAHGGL